MLFKNLTYKDENSQSEIEVGKLNKKIKRIRNCK